jgi:hypothetical protein
MKALTPNRNHDKNRGTLEGQDGSCSFLELHNMGRQETSALEAKNISVIKTLTPNRNHDKKNSPLGGQYGRFTPLEFHNIGYQEPFAYEPKKILS